MPKVSVIVPCYNSEKYVERCLKALEKQLFQDFEVIVIDDCSTDETVRIITEYADRSALKINLQKNDKNCGPAFSRNKGIRLAQGEYIAFCDSDDWYDLDFLSVMIKSIENNSTDIAFCGYKIVSSHNNCELRALDSDKQTVSLNEALKLEIDSLCITVVKSEIIQNTLLPDIRNGEDMAVIPLLISKASSCSIIKECLYNYYRNNCSASQRATMQTVESLIISFEYIKNNYLVDDIKALEYIGIRNLLYAGLITLFSVSYSPHKASEILDKFEKDFPLWHKNEMIRNMPKYKKLVLKFAHLRCYPALFLIAFIRKLRNR